MMPKELLGAAAALGQALADFENELDKYKSKLAQLKEGDTK